MKTNVLKSVFFSALLGTMLFTSCSDDDTNGGNGNEQAGERWITVAGALMQDAPGDGNGGTKIYAVSAENALDQNYTIDVYSNGEPVISNRTARLQSSENGNTVFNIAYTGDNGGTFSKYNVNGGRNYVQTGSQVDISDYAGTSPRWAKLFDGDRTGVAVNVTSPQIVEVNGAYGYTRGTSTVLTLDLQNPRITQVKQFQVPLTAQEEAEGHHLFRLDSPILNAAGNKLIIGMWMRKTNPLTGANQSNYDRLGAKSLVVDYPSLENPVVITSTVTGGDTTGYRSFNGYVANDNNIYQATQRGANGSYILKIGQNNQYDNSYVFSLDAALGVTGSYVDSWRYAGNGKALVAYNHAGATDQGFLALIDLNSKTAIKIEGIPYQTGLDFGQYQGFVVNGDNVFVAVTPVGLDGNIYAINKNTGAVTKGAKLVNQTGNHYIGVF